MVKLGICGFHKWYVSGDWYPGRLTQAETTFQGKGADWAAAGPSWADVWPIAPRQPATPNASGRPRRNRPTLFINKAFSRLARSWAETVIGTADCPEQSTSPMTPSRPRRNRHTQEKLTPRSVGALITRSLMRYPGISG